MSSIKCLNVLHRNKGSHAKCAGCEEASPSATQAQPRHHETPLQSPTEVSSCHLQAFKSILSAQLPQIIVLEYSKMEN